MVAPNKPTLRHFSHVYKIVEFLRSIDVKFFAYDVDFLAPNDFKTKVSVCVHFFIHLLKIHY